MTSAQPDPDAPASEAPETPAASDAPELTATGRVVLAMIGFGRQTGYDIKQLVDKSTRHFWAASYGQIYPELRRLEDHGLIRGRPEPTGGRPRTVYELTPAGQAAVKAWLHSNREPLYEVRDEGMLKLFFSGLGEPEQRIENLRAMRERHERKLAQLRMLEPFADEMTTGPAMTLRLGIGVTQWTIDWLAAAERDLQKE